MISWNLWSELYQPLLLSESYQMLCAVRIAG